jgi:S-adenosylmethionine-diacylglycerol 3-amino-3-carboxypropyl transferase
MKKNKDQVQLTELVFSQNWEDPICDHTALKIKSNDVVMAITSGACNVLGFLEFDPKEIHSIDINAAQSFLLELKICAMKSLTFEEFLCFSGLTKCQNRMVLFEKFQSLLSLEALYFWNKNQKVLKKGFLMNGRYDKFVKFAGKFLKIVQGKTRIDRLFEEKSLESQKEYYDKIWNTKRYRAIYKLLFNKYILARKGLSADYFHFDDGSSSFAESFYKRAKNAFRDMPIKNNYFLSLYVRGKYASLKEVPEYMKEAPFNTIRPRLDRIHIHTIEAQNWIDTMEDNSIDCFALSNICELMSESETERLFKSVYRTAKPGARLIFRNLMIPREVPESLRDSIVKDQSMTTHLQKTDRSFVYGKVAAYTITKLNK